MTKDTFRGICRLVMSGEESGEKKFVENLDNHKVAKVVSCSDDALEVELKSGGRHAMWSPEKCEEKTYGYKPIY